MSVTRQQVTLLLEALNFAITRRTILLPRGETRNFAIRDFDQFLSEVDMVVTMVKHDHIKQNWDKLKGKVILDCHNICPIEGVYHI